ARLHALPESERKRRRRAVGIAPGQPNYRILVVEDKRDSRRLLVKLMRLVGLEVQEAVNGEEAVQINASWHPHLIWMDIDMPVLDGIRATQAIKATGRKVAIVALTASAFAHERESILQAGCDDLLVKPFQNADLFDMIHRHLGVQFIYADQTQPLNVPVTMQELTLDPAHLEQLSTAQLETLRQAAVLLDLESAQEVLVSLPSHAALLTQYLAEALRNYRFDKILALISQWEAMQP
ncbi:MAG: response regulator, partial [Anaerolineae bacterium]|nr:response regulator [Anaerolineae bacterium]